MQKTSNDTGWICLHRKLLDNPICEKADYLAVWVHLLLMANHKETTFIWNNKKQTLKAGQLLTGRKRLSKKTGVAESQVYKILKYLELEQQIEQQKTTKYTIITIVNWGMYQEKEQQKEQQSNNRVTTEEQQSNTYNNNNNNNNVDKRTGGKKTISKDIGKTPTPTKGVDSSKKEAYGNSDINTCISYLQEKLESSLDGSAKENRQYCYNLLRKMKKDFPNTNEVEQVKLLIDVALQDKFHSRNTTGFKYLYYNTQRIAQSFKGDFGVGERYSDIQTI